MMKNNTLIYVAGPTSIGKTKFSIELAKKFKTDLSIVKSVIKSNQKRKILLTKRIEKIIYFRKG